MTFPFPPNRSSSDEEMLDQYLNEWVSGFDAHQHGNSDADPIAFHRWADDTRRTDPAATGPAAGTWNRVLRNFAQESPKANKRMASTKIATPLHGYRIRPNASVGETFMHYSKLIATLALVFAVTAGGWFAMSQMPGRDAPFAGMQGTPDVAQAQMCEVEPLTVDEVVAIVENPMSAIEPSWFGTPTPGEDVSSSNLMQNQELLESPFESVPSLHNGTSFTVPDGEDFDAASGFLETWLNCQSTGTIGQMWALQSPLSIQREILSRHPVYRDPDAIRKGIESSINEPYPDQYSEVYPELNVSANPRVGDARVWIGDSPFSLDYTKVMYIGVQAEDSAGNVVVTENYEGTAVEGDLERGNGVAYILVFSESNDQWFYYSAYAPRG